MMTEKIEEKVTVTAETPSEIPGEAVERGRRVAVFAGTGVALAAVATAITAVIVRQRARPAARFFRFRAARRFPAFRRRRIARAVAFRRAARQVRRFRRAA
jgi:hypothetical protein